MDAAPQAGVYHRYRDLSGLRGQITGDCLHRGSAADGEDSRPRPAARGRGHHAGTGAAGGLTTDADSDINRMGGWPRVVFGRRPGFGESRVTIESQMPGSVTFSTKLVRARVLTGPLILAWLKEYLGYTSYPPTMSLGAYTIYDMGLSGGVLFGWL